MTNVIKESEFRERVANIRTQMRRRGIEALLIYSQKRGHVTYVSGYRPNYHTNSSVIVLPLESDPILWIKFPFDIQRARASSWFEDLRCSPSEETGKMVADCAGAIRQRGLDRARIGLVGKDLAMDEISSSLYEHIRSCLPKADLGFASDLVNDVRLIKSQAEVELLRGAAQLAELAASHLARTIKPGVVDREACLNVEHLVKSEGGEQCDVILSRGPSEMALPPAGVEFRRGDTVTCEITVQYQGYWIQICRVFSIGKAADPQKEVYHVCRAAYQAAIRAARPGVTPAQILQAAHKVISEGGYHDFIQYGAGHGVGLDLPEAYAVEAECHDSLRPFMVLVVHPAIWVPKAGTAFVGGPVVVTEDSAERLDKSPLELVEI